MSKVWKLTIEGPQHALASSKCDHEFRNVQPASGDGLTAECPKCKCRITAWPGTIDYEAIKAAMGREE